MKLNSEPLWQPRRRITPRAVPAQTWDWLVDDASLTRRLRGVCGEGFGVRLLRQGFGIPEANEAAALGLVSGRAALLREVLLHCRGVPWVFARSVLPVVTLSGAGRRLARLGERPLGELLFGFASSRRGEVEIAGLRPTQRLFARAAAVLDEVPATLWGRRSCFHLASGSLLVCEVFLPHGPAHTVDLA